MEYLKSLFTSSTSRGRAVRTALQSFVTLSGMLIVIFTFPDIDRVFRSFGLELQLSTIAAVIGFVSYLQNKAEELLRKTNSDGKLH